MNLPNYLAVPVAAVSGTWLVDTFYPQVESLIADGCSVIIIPSDSSQEGDYLLESIRNRGNRKCVELRVPPEDPTSVWNGLVGNGDDLAPVNWVSNCAVLIFGSHCLQPGWVMDRLPLICGMCSAYSSVAILAVYPRAAEAFLEKNLVGVVKAESLTEIPQETVTELAKQLIYSRLNRLDEQVGQRLAIQLAKAGPSSRSQLELWVDDYIETDPSNLFDKPIPPFTQYLPTEPRPLIRKEQLRVTFETALARLVDSSFSFSCWSGVRLFEDIHDTLSPPFVSYDPQTWLSSIVSRLASLMFDAGHVALPFLSRYSFDSKLKDVVASPQHEFLTNLRLLRTFMQHGLKRGDKEDAKTFNKTMDWFSRGCGCHVPRREHWRQLTKKFLDELTDFTLRLQSCVENLGTCQSASVIKLQWSLNCRHLQRIDVKRLFVAAVSDTSPGLDPELLTQTHFSTVQSRVCRSSVRSSWLLEEAAVVVSGIVIEECVKCPIRASDLMEMGVEKGRPLGIFLKYAEEKWKSDLSISKEDLMREIGDLWTSMHGAK